MTSIFSYGFRAVICQWHALNIVGLRLAFDLFACSVHPSSQKFRSNGPSASLPRIRMLGLGKPSEVRHGPAGLPDLSTPFRVARTAVG